MDKETKLKCQLIEVYSDMLQRMQIGYPMNNYCVIKEAMQALNYIENASLPTYKINTLLDKYSVLLTQL